jgi:hypothetical protein
MITIPTLSQLTSSILSDLQAAYGASIPAFTKNMLRVQALVQAAKLKIFYLAIGSLQKNIFVDTADPVASGGTLERFGFVKLGRNPFPARSGQYVCLVSGTVGAVIAANTTFKSDDNSTSPGMLFVIDNNYTLVGSDRITLRALTAGQISKLTPYDTLTATAPIGNVNSSVIVIGSFIDPADAENIEDYRQSAIEAYRLEPQGGAATDYRIWAKDAQGVQNTYPYAKSGANNEINLYVEATIADSTDGKGTPSAGLLSDVEDVVEFDPDTTKPLSERGRRPLGVFQVHYLPITPKNIDIGISGFSGVTAEQQATILEAMTQALSNVRPYIAASDILSEKNDIFSTNNIISIILSAVPGAIFSSVSLSVASVGVSSYQFQNGDIPFLNTIIYS